MPGERLAPTGRWKEFPGVIGPLPGRASMDIDGLLLGYPIDRLFLGDTMPWG